MAKARLTKQMVEGITPGDRDRIIWDIEVPGFGVKVTKAGRRVYFCYFRTLTGQQRRPSIGVHGAISCEAAREIAAGMLEEVRKGGDPGRDRRVNSRSPALPPFRALLLEDHEFQRHIGIEVLNLCGASFVHGAANGTEAIAAMEAQDKPFDVLVCDLNMPGMDGLEFLRHIAMRRSASSVILASGLDPSIVRSAEMIAKSYDVRVIGSVEKPLSQGKLLPLILRHFGQNLLALASQTELMSLEDIQAGVSRGQFEPFFQPMVSTRDCSLTGVEALLRWHHPKRGLILPGAFIPVMESSGLIEKMTPSIIEASLAQCRKWHDLGLKIPVSVNFSVKSLSDGSLPDRLQMMTKAAGLMPRDLVVEITETTAMIDVDYSLETLARIRMKGFGLALDDFGAGFSSMRQLHRIPFSELKIHQSVVNGSASQPVRLALLESSVAMARDLRLRSTAEGVESNGDWSIIARYGCDIAQGYFIGRPMPGNELPSWYQSWLGTHADLTSPAV